MAGSYFIPIKKKVIVVAKFARIISCDTENIYVDMTSVQWVRETSPVKVSVLCDKLLPRLGIGKFL